MEIKELNAEQIQLANKISSEWISLLGNRDINKDEVEKGLDFYYSLIDLPRPQEIIYVSSPLAMQYAYHIKTSPDFKNTSRSVNEDTIKSIKKKDVAFQHMFSSGSIYDYHWAAYYEFFELIGVKYEQETQEKFDKMKTFLKKSGVFDMLLYKEFAIVCEHPIEVHQISNPRDKNIKLLHKDLGPALKWRDGFSVYSLNGVQMPKDIVMTPSGNLKLEHYEKLTLADQRIEFLSKFGPERMISLGKELDNHTNHIGRDYYEDLRFKESEYKLIDMSSVYGGDKQAKFLYMKHFSTGQIVLECVGSSPKNIKEALDWRDSKDLSNYRALDCA